MSMEVDMVTPGEDLCKLLEWLTNIVRGHPTQRWSLYLRLRVIKESDP